MTTRNFLIEIIIWKATKPSWQTVICMTAGSYFLLHEMLRETKPTRF